MVASHRKLDPPVSARDHTRGGAQAAVTLVEYGDFDCRYCARAYPVVRALEKHFGSTLRFVFRHNPRGELHEHALIAAQAAEAAALQDRFWEMHDRLFETRSVGGEPALVGHAEALGIERARFLADLHSPAVRARVREDEASGLRSGVVGTPTFFVDGAHFWEAPDFAALSRAIAARHVGRTEARRAAQPRTPSIQRVDGSGHYTLGYRAPEDEGGPFVETSGRTEFAHGADASNIPGATREPFPKT